MVFIFSLLKLVENNVFVICPWPCFFITGTKKRGSKDSFKETESYWRGKWGFGTEFITRLCILQGPEYGVQKVGRNKNLAYQQVVRPGYGMQLQEMAPLEPWKISQKSFLATKRWLREPKRIRDSQL